MSRNSLPKNLKNDARGLALKAFRALRQGKTSQEALDGALAGSSLPQAEKNLASELFYGVCRNRIRLDYIANKFLAKPASLPAAMQDILNIALSAKNTGIRSHKQRGGTSLAKLWQIVRRGQRIPAQCAKAQGRD